jgi:hypothetical protein
MVIEVGFLASGEREPRPMSSPSWHGLGVLSLVLEPMIFTDATAHFEPQAYEGTFDLAPALRPSDFDARFVNTLRQTDPVEMEAGIIPVCPLSVAQAISAPLPPSSIPLSPLHHHRRNRPAPVIVPHHSVRLDKKAASHPPTVVTAQNLLMKKLGLLSDGKVDTTSFD